MSITAAFLFDAESAESVIKIPPSRPPRATSAAPRYSAACHPILKCTSALDAHSSITSPASGSAKSMAMSELFARIDRRRAAWVLCVSVGLLSHFVAARVITGARTLTVASETTTYNVQAGPGQPPSKPEEAAPLLWDATDTMIDAATKATIDAALEDAGLQSSPPPAGPASNQPGQAVATIPGREQGQGQRQATPQGQGRRKQLQAQNAVPHTDVFNDQVAIQALGLTPSQQPPPPAAAAVQQEQPSSLWRPRIFPQISASWGPEGDASGTRAAKQQVPDRANGKQSQMLQHAGRRTRSAGDSTASIASGPSGAMVALSDPQTPGFSSSGVPGSGQLAYAYTPVASGFPSNANAAQFAQQYQPFGYPDYPQYPQYLPQQDVEAASGPLFDAVQNKFHPQTPPQTIILQPVPNPIPVQVAAAPASKPSTPTIVGSGGIKVVTSDPVSISNPIKITNPNVNGVKNTAVGGGLLGVLGR